MVSARGHSDTFDKGRVMIKIEDHPSIFGTITIYKRKQSGSLIYDQGGCCQSEVDGSGVSLASYVHAICDLILQMGAQNILMIGCGGGTLGTMLAKAGRHVTIVDIDPAAFHLARRYFGLPEQIICHVADGGEFLQSSSRTYDAVVLDAFQGNHIPTHLQSCAFFRLVRSRLSQLGSIFANVHVMDDGDVAPDRMANRMSNIWLDVRLLDSPGWRNRNAIVMAGHVRQLQPPTLCVPLQGAIQEIASELDTLQFRSWRNCD
jgi:spermidine synthase